MKHSSLSRRRFLKMAGSLGAVSAAGHTMGTSFFPSARAQSQGTPPLLFVVAAAGGASITDSFLAVRSADSQGGGGLNTFSDAMLSQPFGSAFRIPKTVDASIEGAIDLGNQYPMNQFLTKHGSDVSVLTQECTSVNHLIGAKRCLNGNQINAGRTIQEAMALRWGEGLLLPNANMSGGGYILPGDDDSIPNWARAEPIADAKLFAFSTHPSRGIKGAPDENLLAHARQVRSSVEAASPFLRTFKNSSLIQNYQSRRALMASQMEAANLIQKLMLFQNSGQVPLSDFDLESSPLSASLISHFPKMLTDPYEGQAALAFLLARYGVSNAITFGVGSSPVFESTERIVNAPIGFDWSHNDHLGGQNTMWSRVLKTLDGLIDLLKTTDYLGDPTKGKMWEHSLIFVATEFGREKSAGGGGSGHHLNNGNVIISPLIKGNKVYGGVDPNTLLTYGFDPQTGQPAPGTLMHEEHVYSAVAHALDIDFPNRINMPGLLA